MSRGFLYDIMKIAINSLCGYQMYKKIWKYGCDINLQNQRSET